MELKNYPNTDVPYTGVIWTAATSIYDSKNPSFFTPGETFPDMEGGIYLEQIFDNREEAEAAYAAQIERAKEESKNPEACSWPYDTIAVLLFVREYADGLLTDNFRKKPFDNNIICQYPIALHTS